MRRKTLFTFTVTLFFSLNLQSAHAQTEAAGKIEVGGQFSAFNVMPGRASVTRTLPCFIPPCPVVTDSTGERSTEPGFGGRIGYNVTEYFTVEAEGNFFPREREFAGGRKIQGLFGVKAGRRFEQVGVFAKARPGFVRFSEGDLSQPRMGVACVFVIPAPAACYEPTARTDFAFDVGGVLELYPTRRTIIRFDAGNTIIRLGEHRAPVVINPQPGLTALPSQVVVGSAPSDTVHNFQGSIGFGFRF